MTAECALNQPEKKTAEIGFFERWLTVWVFFCIGAGVILGQLLPGVFKADRHYGK